MFNERRNKDCVGHTVRRDSLLRRVIEGRMEGHTAKKKKSIKYIK